MARFPSPLDVRVSSAMIDVCEDLGLDIDKIAQEIVEEFEDSLQPASYEAICAELRKAREVQIATNQFFDQYVDGAESAYLDRLYVEAP